MTGSGELVRLIRTNEPSKHWRAAIKIKHALEQRDREEREMMGRLYDEALFVRNVGFNIHEE